MDYKRVQALCVKNNIEFENQSYPQLIKQVKDNFYNSQSKRQEFTNSER
jgi:hypothetical protein